MRYLNSYCPDSLISAIVVLNPTYICIELKYWDITDCDGLGDSLLQFSNVLCWVFVLFPLTPNGPSGAHYEFCFSSWIDIEISLLPISSLEPKSLASVTVACGKSWSFVNALLRVIFGDLPQPTPSAPGIRDHWCGGSQRAGTRTACWPAGATGPRLRPQPRRSIHRSH